MYNINLIYEYSTPYGILKNGIHYSKINSIYKNSLTHFEKEWYDSNLYSYFTKLNELDEYNISFVHYNDIRKFSSTETGNVLNLYCIENFSESEIYINDLVVNLLKETDNYYFLFENFNKIPTDKNIEDLSKFKKEFFINKNRFIYTSDIKPTTNIQWQFMESSIGDLNKEVFIKKIIKIINGIKLQSFI